MNDGVEWLADGNWQVLRVYGEVDLSWSQELRQQVLRGLAEGRPLAIMLRDVNYMDSSGIAALVEGFQQSRLRKGRFALIAPSAPVRAVLELARLDRVFPIFADLVSAQQA
jgi:anti-sigma B factor antagonist